MGQVYKAQDERLDRVVALKFLSSELARDSHALERLHREAKAASALNHPNICTIYDFGEDEGRAFISMEYLEGETLSGRIANGPIPLHESLHIAGDIAAALSAAHRKGMVHRDLKPGNIMLGVGGTKLLDFGLAKFGTSTVTNTIDSAGATAITGETITATSGASSVAGTLPYMSPEQLRGGAVDVRGDVFAFGTVLYEMLTGHRAFQRTSKIDTIVAVGRDEPQPLRELVKDIPDELDRLILRCLRKNASERYPSAVEIQPDLAACSALVSPPASISLNFFLRQMKRPRVATPTLLALALLASFSGWFIHRGYRERWARNVAVPLIAQLNEEGKNAEAYALALEAERYIPKDPILTNLLDQISWSDTISTNPSGVSVYRRNYNAPENEWEYLGKSPVEKHRFPLVDSRWKFEKAGYASVERTTTPDRPTLTLGSPTLTMVEEINAPFGMVRVELATPKSQTRPVHLYGLAGYEALAAMPLTDFWIDKFEVTNAEYKKFVDQGGYQKPQYWKQEFEKDHKSLSWSEAMKSFVDSTGRPGPATWMEGEYPRGRDNYPVMGVSWFEAAAYAEFVGKSLPTIYHWTAAAFPADSATIIPASNFGGIAPAAVGSYRGMSWSGAFDMAGNVKEWIFNQGAPDKRYIMGGAWNEPVYMFYDADAHSPFERAPNFGFRCAKYLSTDAIALSTKPVTVHARNYSLETPVSDELFRAYKSLYSYDRTPLHEVVESTQQTEDWTLQKITYDAAYGNERITAYLYLPRNTKPPFETVVYFPGANAVRTRSSAPPPYLDDYEFVIRSGRAVLFPLYKSTFERGDGVTNVWPNDSSSYRDHVIAWSKDLGRSIDYLETRPDIDHDKLAYEGYSWGAAMGCILAAVENRFQALVLIAPGFYLQKRLPEVDQFNFAPRVKAPALMLNGRFDFIYPAAASQEQMFHWLGTPPEHKRRLVYDTAHDIPRTEMIKETLNWLDRYLGPVR